MYAAETYDRVHRARGKDYAVEAKVVAEQVALRRPGAASLLDVACGTGSHLEHLAAAFGHVEGVELEEAMLGLARAKMPGLPLHAGDMRTFDLGRRFDAVTCLFGSVAHLADEAELAAALGRLAAHAVPGGVIAVEPWWFLERFLDGYVDGSVVTVDELTIARVSHSRLEGRVSHMRIHYVVAGAAGIDSFVEDHRLTLFTREQYREAFAVAGIAVDYVPDVLGGRGLFAGVTPG